MDTSYLLIAGDFNLHMDDEANNDTKRTMTVRPHTPWYNDIIRSQKCVRRQLERMGTTGWSVTRSLIALSASLSRHPHTVQNWNTA